MLRAGDEPIPGYRLERFLGRGMFGEVWQSTSPGKTSVALKFLDLSGKAGWREFRSIQQVKQIRHAHLMPITALWLLDDEGRILDDETIDTIADQHTIETDRSSSDDLSSRNSLSKQSDQTQVDRPAPEPASDQPCLSETMRPPMTGATQPPRGSTQQRNKPAGDIEATQRTSDTVASPQSSPPTDAKPRWLVIAQLLGDKTLSDELEECQVDGESGIPANRLLRYMEEAAKGIDFLNSRKHDLGSGPVAVQHCDIKPANILLIGDSVLICDFGVTRVLADADLSITTTSMPGSPAYMAPECIAKRPSSASDQYSLAITYYELRTGKLPFRSQEYLDVMEAHRNGTLDLSHLPGEERAVIRKATSVNPADRYTRAVDMVAALKQAALGSQDDSSKSWLRRAAVPVALLLMVAIVMLMTIALNRDPSGAARVVNLKVQPVDATVMVNGEPHSPDPQGAVQLEVDPQSTLQIVVRKPPEYSERTTSVPVANLDPTAPLLIQLEPNADYYATQAFMQLKGKQWDEAVQLLAKAMALDRDWATFPMPEYYQQLKDNTLDRITCLACSHDGEYLIAGGRGQGVRVWSRSDQRGAAGRTIYRHQVPVDALAVGNRTAATADFSGHVAVHQLDTGKQLATLALNADIIALAISADDSWLFTASAGEQGRYLVDQWSLATKNISSSRTGRVQHDLTVDTILIAPGDRLLSADWLGRVSRFEMAPSGAVTEQFVQMPHGAAVMDMAIAGTGSDAKVILGGAETQPDAPDACRLVSMPLGANEPEARRVFPSGHATAIEVVSVAPNNRIVASGGDDGTVQLWRLDEQGNSLPTPTARRRHAARVGALAFGPKSQWLVSAGDDGKLVLWDLAGSEQPSAVVIGEHRGTVVRVIIRDDEIISAGDDGTVQTRSLRRCTLIKRAADAAQQSPVTPTTSERATEA